MNIFGKKITSKTINFFRTHSFSPDPVLNLLNLYTGYIKKYFPLCNGLLSGGEKNGNSRKSSEISPYFFERVAARLVNGDNPELIHVV